MIAKNIRCIETIILLYQTANKYMEHFPHFLICQGNQGNVQTLFSHRNTDRREQRTKQLYSGSWKKSLHSNLWLHFIKNAAHANTTHKTSEGGKNNAEKAKIYIDCSHYLAAYAAWHAAL